MCGVKTNEYERLKGGEGAGPVDREEEGSLLEETGEASQAGEDSSGQREQQVWGEAMEAGGTRDRSRVYTY